MFFEKREIVFYITESGTRPCKEWLGELKDVVGRQIIHARITRLGEGNPGHYRFLGGGLFELKIDFGPGYRVYYTKDQETLIILLCGGDKTHQNRDIDRAREYLTDYWRRK